MLSTQLFNFVLRERNTSAGHDPFGRCDELVEIVQLPFLASAPREAWDVLGLKPTAENVAASADDCSGVEHRVDAALRVVAHEHTTKLQAAVDEITVCFVPKSDRTVVAFEVAGIGVGPEVAPFSDDGIAQESVVPFVAVSCKSNI